MKYEPTWDSLSQYEIPDWFRDSKFGIFLHWGVQSVPADNGWYARFMYMQEGALWGNAYEHHIENYGHPSLFGYKDLIPLWKAEHWDPSALVAFFKEIGARYVVPVAVHHDNFDNYDSSFQPWNSVKMGPKRDVVAEWKKAAMANGLRFGVSTHSDRMWDWFITAQASDSVGELMGVPYDGNLSPEDGEGLWWEGLDPKDLYGPIRSLDQEPDSKYCDLWLKRTLELIDKYQPDLLYFDGPLPIVRPIENGGLPHDIRSRYGLKVAAHFYNANELWHDGHQEAILNIKEWEPGSVPNEAAIVLDIEKGQSERMREHPWQTDTSLNTEWYYSPEPLELGETMVIHNLCDIVSKNGNLLLNVGLRADGTLPQDQKLILEEVGRWLAINGEAIYGSRPWTHFGEGPTGIEHGDFKQNKEPFTVGDFRFTTKGDALYAITFAIAENNQVLITSIKKDENLWFGLLQNVKVLGDSKELTWSFTNEGLVVEIPEDISWMYGLVLVLE